MFSALVSGSSGPGSSPGCGHCVVFLGKTLHFHNASLQVYKWVPANLMLGVTLQWTSIPSRGSRNTSNRYGNRDKLRTYGPLGSYADFTFTLC